MKSFVFAAVVAAGSLLVANDVWATKVETSRDTVNAQCGTSGTGNVNCTKTCGSTTCDFSCKDNKCSVTIRRPAPPPPPPHQTPTHPTGAEAH